MAYSFQSFSVNQVATAAQMNQESINARDHIHGQTQVANWYEDVVLDAGSANNIVVALQPTCTVINTGMNFRVLIKAGNSAAVNAAVDSVGSKAVVSVVGSALIAGQLPAGSIVHLAFDGTKYRVISQQPVGTTIAQLSGGTGTATVVASGNYFTVDRYAFASPTAVMCGGAGTARQIQITMAASGSDGNASGRQWYVQALTPSSMTRADISWDYLS